MSNFIVLLVVFHPASVQSAFMLKNKERALNVQLVTIAGPQKIINITVSLVNVIINLVTCADPEAGRPDRRSRGSFLFK